MKRTIFTIALTIMFSVFLVPETRAHGHGEIAGKFFLQVESSGELWYILPETGERFYIQNPKAALQLIKNTGIGITNSHLEMIERADGHSGAHIDKQLTKRLAGKFLLQVENNGEAWYVNPMDMKRYSLGSPDEAFKLFSSIAAGIDNASAVTIPEAKSIVDVAVGAGTFETLVAAAQAAGLAGVLDESGPFTVFAPNDEAFAKLPAGTLESLLADPEALANILLYHVTSGKVTADKVVGKDNVATLQGGSLKVDVSDGVKVNQSSVIATDIMAVNGVIHVIDTVLLP